MHYRSICLHFIMSCNFVMKVNHRLCFIVCSSICVPFLLVVQFGLPRTVAARTLPWTTRRRRRQWRRWFSHRWRQGERRGRRRPIHLTVRDGPKGQRRFEEDQSFVLALLKSRLQPKSRRVMTDIRNGSRKYYMWTILTSL